MINAKRGAALAAVLAAGTAYGAGFQLYTEGSAEALGQAGAISGRTNLISLAWYNPAALAGREQAAVMSGASWVQIRTDFNREHPAASDSAMEDEWRTIPHFYYVQPVSEELTALLSINAPYGLITEWPQGWSGSAAARYSELATVFITPSVAYRINDRLSLSAGVNVVYAEARLTANRGALGEREIEGNDLGWGYTCSGHYQFSDAWGLGARFQSGVKLEPQGEVVFDAIGAAFDTTGYTDLPASVNIGLANRSIENLHLGLDVVWSEWSSYDELVFEFGAGYPAPPLDNPEENAKDWDDVWSVRLGAEYALTENWMLRGGYVWDQSPVNEHTRAPELPGSDRQMVMCGLGWQGEQVGIDVAYSFLWADSSDTGRDITAAIPTAAGEYETTSHLIALSGSYTF